jgi:DNA-binding PadR family transcriptional regulator
VLAPLDLVVLVALTRHPNGTHGYDLLHTMRDTYGVDAATTSLYRALRQQLERGLVAEVALEEGADPRRRCYRITAAGVEAVSAERTRLMRLFDGTPRSAGAWA